MMVQLLQTNGEYITNLRMKMLLICEMSHKLYLRFVKSML